MAEINEVKTRLSAFIAREGYASQVSQDVAALIAELETVRAERDALRAALQSVYDTASTPLDPDDDDETEMRNRLDQIETRAYEALWTDDSAALNTQPAPAPQAEWTPRAKQDVRVIDTAHSMYGKVGAIIHRNDAKTWFWIDFDPSDYDGKEVYHLRLDQIAPVDESEA